MLEFGISSKVLAFFCFFESLARMPIWLIVVVLGIVEGITEFLPVSSTGHLLVTEKLLQMAGLLSAESWLVKGSPQKDLFNIVIQSGAVLAVIPLFRERFHQFLFKWRQPETQLYAGKLLLACAITGLPGYVLDKRGFKLPEELTPIALALFVGGLGFILIENWLKGRPLLNEVTWTMAVAVGVGQLLAAIFPGTSRSGATILLCLILGLNRPAATEFCFLVGIPTMLAAGGLKIFKALHHTTQGAAPQHWDIVLLGFVISAIVSFISVKWLLRYIQTHTFELFGWYRIAAAAVVLALLLLSR
jgi:undecaprenyl-diphosphatase